MQRIRLRHREQVRFWREAARRAGLKDLKESWTSWVTGSLGTLVVNLISDFTYTLVDPRIDFETREV